jgi:hypothetical protein
MTSSYRATRATDAALCGVALALLGLIWIWPSAYLAFTVDDAFYYLQTARNIAAGLGATFDRFEPTDGYHPLWCYSLVGLLWLLAKANISDTATVVRVILSLQTLLVVAAGYWLSRAEKRTALPSGMALGLTGLLASFYGAKVLINGQESALQFALLVAALLVLARRSRYTEASTRSALLLGMICGLAALARLEAALFGCACIVGLAVHGPQSRTVRYRETLLAAAVFVVVCGPYWVAHYFESGHWVPVSGVIKSERAWGSTFPALAGMIVVLAFAIWLWRNRAKAELRSLLPLWVYVLGLQAYLALVRGELLPEIWYCVPHALLGLAYWTQVVGFIERKTWGGFVRTALALSAALLVLATWLYRALPSSYSRYRTAADFGPWLDQYLPSNARVASWDAGIVAAHSARSVTNLDGLINSWQFKLRYLDTSELDQYLSTRNIDYLVQYFPLAWLQRDTLQWNGVDLRDWHVLEARPFELRRLGHFWQTEPNVYLALSRDGTTPPLRQWAHDFSGGPR